MQVASLHLHVSLEFGLWAVWKSEHDTVIDDLKPGGVIQCTFCWRRLQRFAIEARQASAKKAAERGE